MLKTELHPAWWCYCEACGVQNFIAPMLEELTPDQAEAVEEEGFDPTTLERICIPDTVVCGACGVEQEVDHGE